jgi:hypothetical protein
MKALLLVTWIVTGQPPNSYQTSFDTMDLCLAARATVVVESDLLNSEAAQAANKITNLVGELSNKWIAGGMPPDTAVSTAQQFYKIYLTPLVQSKVSAVCVVQ